jgi:hypothetical protein
MSTRQRPLTATLFPMLNSLFQENLRVLQESVSVFSTILLFRGTLILPS